MRQPLSVVSVQLGAAVWKQPQVPLGSSETLFTKSGVRPQWADPWPSMSEQEPCFKEVLSWTRKVFRALLMKTGDLILQDVVAVAATKDLPSIEEDAIGGCLKEGQVHSGFKDTIMDARGVCLYSHCLSEQSQTCGVMGGPASNPVSEFGVFLYKNQ